MMNWYFASGDLDFFWKEQLLSLSWLPQVFRRDLGFGASGLLSLWLDYPFRLFIKLLSTFGLSWFFIEKLLWASVFLLAIYSSYRLAMYVLKESRVAWVAPIIYTLNTYLLLLFSGGQFGVALAYAFAPLVFLKCTRRKPIANGLWLALLVAFDLRIAYLIIGAIIISMLFFKKFSALYSLGITLIIAASIHLYWILPTVLASNGTANLGEQFTNPGMLKFLSVADFSHAVSLLHPNWPENLFGKVYFLQPEFIILPIVAFSSLLFLKTEKKLYVLFFGLLALLGAFLSKGVRDPFGGVFAWMFVHIHGFIMFRDPTKFYLYTALGYSLVIPFVLGKITGYMRGIGFKRIVIITFIIFWLYTLRAVFTGQTTGNFQPTQMPYEYVQLKDLLVADRTHSRTLWIPQKENYAYFSDVHPLLATDSAFVKESLFVQKISRMGVRYVIVPQDINRRLFLTDYRFDPNQRSAVVDSLRKTSLKQNMSFRDIAVFENEKFDFEGVAPKSVVRQQNLANIGTVVSAIVLLFFGSMLVVTRKKP